MASTRERRSNAGNKMARLLDEEEVDEFYQETYGGFTETNDDRDYVQKDAGDDDDVVDSDFSIDENDEVISDHEEEEGKRRKRKVVTRAYKEPVSKKTKKEETPKQKTPKKTKTPVKKSSPHKQRFTVHDTGRKSFRQSTTQKARETQIRLKERHEAEKKKPKVQKVEEYIPTQEELLEEAKETEKENIKSLEKYKRMELEKKKVRPTKSVAAGPMIRYHSMTMPLVEEVVEKRDSLPADGQSGARRSERKANERKIVVTNKCERTFITFLNDIDNKVFDSVFKPKPKRQPIRSKICPITQLPAKYFDPVTQIPYNNLIAFKIIREAYYQQLEEYGNRDNEQVAKFLEYRRQLKEYRAKFSKSSIMASL
ncbi:vacuolar protein sorting-associated protein 72 homolog [Culicoides brevitarsis]|uniref:vacuolar protein sorting-associated protein 72 homolog n=1 Tax=Culicoides brevitarsis TaxID=469753 RepID=UPI00307CA938